MTRQRRPRPPLDRRHLEELALRYVGRFATSRKRLASYLQRKVKERGWQGDEEAPIGGIVERLASLGYVDDAAFALSRARSMGSRGYGPRRLAGALAADGIEEDDSAPAMQHAAEDSADAILRFARRRRIGPFAEAPCDRPTQEKWLAAMIRAGHDFTLARKIAHWPPGEAPSAADLTG